MTWKIRNDDIGLPFDELLNGGNIINRPSTYGQSITVAMLDDGLGQKRIMNAQLNTAELQCGVGRACQRFWRTNEQAARHMR